MNVSIEFGDKYKRKFLKFKRFNEFDLYNIFSQENEKIIEYRPLKTKRFTEYEHMLIKFEENNNSILKLWNVLDNSKKKHILKYYKLDKFVNESSEMVDFFIWILNKTEWYIFRMEPHPIDMTKQRYVKRWKKNVITFYYSLPDKQKTYLLSEFNKL